jgi:hypothetical protein
MKFYLQFAIAMISVVGFTNAFADTPAPSPSPTPAQTYICGNSNNTSYTVDCYNSDMTVHYYHGTQVCLPTWSNGALTFAISTETCDSSGCSFNTTLQETITGNPMCIITENLN